MGVARVTAKGRSDYVSHVDRRVEDAIISEFAPIIQIIILSPAKASPNTQDRSMGRGLSIR